jgi:peptidoglycan/xylan/chitin deacetylase (PgdA/CDA1 family)
MKEKIADLAFSLGLFSVLAPISRGRGTILMLHEVHQQDEIARFDGCTIAKLDGILSALRRWDIDLIAMDDLLPRLQSDNPRHFAVITMDDGYRDNLLNALPVFERYNAPVLINVPTGAVTRDLYCWWLALRELFMTRGTLRIEPLERTVDIREREKRFFEYRKIQRWIAADFVRAEQLRPWFDAEGISFPELCNRFFMSAEELKRCASHPLVTIGGHSVTHRSLASLPETQLLAELSDNKTFLESLLQAPVHHFAYPFGGPAQCGPREAAAARQAGYRTAIAVRHGRLTSTTNADPHMMPRHDIGYSEINDRRLYGVLNGLYDLRSQFGNGFKLVKKS